MFQIKIRKYGWNELSDILLQYLISIFLLFNGNAMWKYVVGGLTVSGIVSYSFLTFILSLVCLIYSVKQWVSDGISKKEVSFLGVLIGYNLIYIILSRHSAVAFIGEFVLPLVAFTAFMISLKERHGINLFFQRLSNVVVMLAFISVFAFFGGEVLGIIPAETVRLYRNGYYYSVPCYFNLTYMGQTGVILGHEVVRNTGIFLESPGWIFPLAFSLFVELFIRRRKIEFNVVILILAALTSFSTKGFLVIPLIILFKLYEKKDRERLITKQIRTLLLPIILVVGITGVYFILLNKSIDGAISFYSRIEDTLVALKVWKNNFFLGCGFGNLEAYENYLLYQDYSSITNGLLKAFSQCGVLIGVELLLCAVGIYNRFRGKIRFIFMCLFIIFIFFLISSSTWTSSLLLMLLAFGCSNFYNNEGLEVKND